MRIILVLCAVLVIGIGGYVGYDLNTEISALNVTRQARQSDDRTGVRHALASHPRYTFDQVVHGPGDTAKTREFRARANLDGVAQSAYGVIDTACPGDGSLTGLDCWRVSRLVIDGVEIRETKPVVALARPAAADPAEIAPLPVSPAPIPDIAAQPAVAPDISGPEGETAPAPTPEILVASHKVRPNLVNARAAPQGAVEAQLAQGTGLALLETRGGWGRFRVLDGENQDLEIWIALSVLDAV